MSSCSPRTTSPPRSSNRSSGTGSDGPRGSRVSAPVSEDETMRHPAPPARNGGRGGAWRGLFAFRGSARPDLELGIGIGAFVVVIAVWFAVTGLGLVHPQFLP